MSDERPKRKRSVRGEPKNRNIGLEGVEAEAGYSKMPDPAKEEEDWSFDDGRNERPPRFMLRSAEPATRDVEIFYQNPDGIEDGPQPHRHTRACCG